ncbi:hypothetical protein BDN71DRAFT_1204201 [Pleurotus eryngii]|uniref:Uncharacterized protein n=1 Tax=Pleurotus eryngii TaxID=5323 RepID=A0A9P5ZRN3_PLEER|nr:hypothetical protein BDN71DRAFT_1204201 [Pleurotus eryngii]
MSRSNMPTPKISLNLSFVLVAIALGAAGVGAVPATNDWSKPCFDGECAYDLPARGDSALGAFKIAGSPQAITDITPAAGWVILDCDPHALSQEIRLVCQSDDEANDESCSHVFGHWGAVDKIVRLPDGCSAAPFARIAEATVAHDQTLPGHVEGKVVRRDGVSPVIHSFKVDTNFAQVDASKVGDINFAFVGLTSPSPSRDFPSDIDLNFEFVDGWFDDAFKSVGTWTSGAVQSVGKAAGDVGNAVGHAAADVGKAVGQAGQAVGHAAETAGKAVAGAAGAAFQAIKDVPGLLENATSFQFEPKVETAPVKFDGSVNLINYHDAKCVGGGEGGVASGSLKVDLDGKGGGSVKAGVIVDGSIVPPKIKDFAAYAGMSFDVDASVVIKAAILGGYESGRMSVIKPIGLPGLSIPGVLTIGPMIELQAEAKALLDLKIDSNVHLAYKVDNLELWYPKAKKASVEKGIHTKPAPLKLKAKAKANAKGYIEGHLIPSLRLGVSALAGKAGADVFLEADAFARVSVTAEAHATANVKVGGAAPAAKGAPAAAAPAAGKKGKGKRDIYVPPYAYGSRRRDVSVQDGSDGAPAAGVKAGFSGCVDLSAGLELNYGAKANAGDLWKVNESGSLWKSPIWPIWSGCFEAGTKAAKPAGKSSWDPATLEKKFKEKKLTCDATDVGDLEGIPDESLPAKTVQP